MEDRRALIRIMISRKRLLSAGFMSFVLIPSACVCVCVCVCWKSSGDDLPFAYVVALWLVDTSYYLHSVFLPLLAVVVDRCSFFCLAVGPTTSPPTRTHTACQNSQTISLLPTSNRCVEHCISIDRMYVLCSLLIS